MSDLTPEDILDDFARELKYLPKTHRHKFYVEIRDKAKAQLAKCSSPQKEDRPDRGKIAKYLHKMMKAGVPIAWVWDWNSETEGVREEFIYQADQIIALFSDKEETK